MVIGAVVASKIGGRGGGALLALTAIHQLVVLTRVALRASWLAKALRLVDKAHRVTKVGTPVTPDVAQSPSLPPPLMPVD